MTENMKNQHIFNSKKHFSYALLIMVGLYNICVLQAGTKTIFLNADPQIQKGIIIDSVPCKFKNYSYTLYFPSIYTDSLKWPVLYIFDPAARGKIAVEHFIQAAEKYGYILVCSNNSRNGISWNEISDIVDNLLLDTRERISIDTNRMYTSGFSGGSRVATMIALNANNIAGVIACGAGFPVYVDVDKNYKFDYFGLVGNRDMNYYEMCDLEKMLENRKITLELQIFNGEHTWPSPELLKDGVEWMELQAIKKGNKNKDDIFFEWYYEKSKARLNLIKKQDDICELVRCYKNIIKDFPESLHIMNLKHELDSIETSEAYIKDSKKQDKIKSREFELRNIFEEAFNKLILTHDYSDSIQYLWELSIKKLRYMESHGDQNKRNMASRVLSLVKSNCYENGLKSMQTKDYKLATYIFHIETMINPENYYVFIRLAHAYALNNNPKKSIKSLEKAIKLGYNDKVFIEKDTVFISLRSDKRFQEAISRIKPQQKKE
jgi:hypothetical protein